MGDKHRFLQVQLKNVAVTDLMEKSLDKLSLQGGSLMVQTKPYDMQDRSDSFRDQAICANSPSGVPGNGAHALTSLSIMAGEFGRTIRGLELGCKNSTRE